jgi:hypothetical protein
MRLPSLALSSACCTQQRSSFNDGVRRYEKILIDQARSTRYNAYLLAHTATAGAPTIREKEAAADAVLEPQPRSLVTRGRSQGDDRSANAFRALARIKRFLRRACRKPADMPIRTSRISYELTKKNSVCCHLQGEQQDRAL